MSLIPLDELERLATYRCRGHDERCVTIALPTHRASNESEQDRIRLKNLVDRAADLLQEGGVGEGAIGALLDPIRSEMQQDAIFWQNNLDGLCVFRSGEFLYAYRVPYTFEELVVVGPRFHLKPLLPLLSGDGQFYLLTLHQDEVSAYVGTRYELDELDLEGVPEDLEELMIEHDQERPQQWHTDTRVPGGHPSSRTRPATFHGHGVIEQHEEDEILQLYRKIDEVLTPSLGDSEIPLLLAGDDDLVALYQEANTYPYLVDDEAIHANPAGLARKELHRRAWEILEPRFISDRTEARETYEMLAGRGSTRATDDLEEVVSAAYFERVAVLFVARDEEVWGSFDSETSSLITEDNQTKDNEDLLDLAALHTLINGGTVYVVDADAVPSESKVAAVFRY